MTLGTGRVRLAGSALYIHAAVNMGLRGGPGAERGVVACLAGGAAVEQAGGVGPAWVGVGEAGERVVDDDGLPGLVGLRLQVWGERDVPEPWLGVVGDPGAEHDAGLVGAGPDEPGSGSPRQVQDRRADGRVGEFTFAGLAGIPRRKALTGPLLRRGRHLRGAAGRSRRGFR